MARAAALLLPTAAAAVATKASPNIIRDEARPRPCLAGPMPKTQRQLADARRHLAYIR
eukprot:gene37075-32365_t